MKGEVVVKLVDPVSVDELQAALSWVVSRYPDVQVRIGGSSIDLVCRRGEVSQRVGVADSVVDEGQVTDAARPAAVGSAALRVTGVPAAPQPGAATDETLTNPAGGEPVGGAGSLPCPECGRVLSSAVALGVHRRKAHGVVSPQRANVSSTRAPAPATSPTPGAIGDDDDDDDREIRRRIAERQRAGAAATARAADRLLAPRPGSGGRSVAVYREVGDSLVREPLPDDHVVGTLVDEPIGRLGPVDLDAARRRAADAL